MNLIVEDNPVSFKELEQKSKGTVEIHGKQQM